ncbi:2-hydroxyacid dehydrogenase [Fodinibius salsisoli]|uniref:Glyoxylate/hydroxypyruvate reductase A n=1 Tax=Fodinibius salsisoli TaxID=2820877 RepID=A0ABT3PRX4_9BACT|nr:glyoxylate/hydroxypyruvate reductase A [Fodinibius salsisoli]MCW9708606.1 glyoxylate/hydroxypyruvate reductase A [Fodinibius salsisoli]
MSLLLVSPNRDMSSWKHAIKDVDPNIDIDTWPAIEDKEKVQFAVCWNHPSHLLDSFPNLKAVSSLGAGVDHLLSDESLPQSVDICRIVSPSLIQQMKEYVLGCVINIRRNFIHYIRQKDQQEWKVHHHANLAGLSIGIMGLGEIGRPVAQQLTEIGYDVSGWSRATKDIANVDCYAGPDQLSSFLEKTQLLICLLPLTKETEGILDLELFKQLKPNSWIINVARGEHLVDEDLIYALDSNILQGAWLDVFSQEPLPGKHAFWNRSNIMLTPHIASITQPDDAADQIVDNYKRALSGLELNHTVDRERGY